jgi:PPP family 3-phenylpropionic acid transporter
MFFLSHVPVGITLPFLSIYWKETLGLSEREIGHIYTLNAITMIIVQQVWGYLADVVFTRKRLLVVNCCLSGLAFMAAGFATTYYQVVGALFLFTLASCSLSQTLHGLLLAFEDGHQRFGSLRALSSLGFVCANMLVGFIATVLFPGYLWFLFPAMAGSYLLQALVGSGLRENHQIHHEDRPRPTFLSVQKHFLGRPDAVWFLIFVFVYNSAHGLSYSFQGFLLKDLGASNSFTAACYSLAAVLELPVFFASTYLVRRIGVPQILGVCAIIQSVRWYLVWAAESKWQILALSTTHCLTFGLFFAATVHAINEFAGPWYKASAQTLLSLVGMGLSSVFGNIIGSEINRGGFLQKPVEQFVVWVGLADLGPLHNLYLFCSALAALSLVAWIPYFYYFKYYRHSTSGAPALSGE